MNFVTEIDPEEDQIHQWLSPLEPQRRHQGVRTGRFDGIGNWVLETNEFREWSDGENGCVEQVLFCYGNPGVGKTYLRYQGLSSREIQCRCHRLSSNNSSVVIDSLCDRAVEEDIAVVGLYCDFLAQQEQSTTNMLGATLKQLASRREIPKDIQDAFQKAREEFGGQGLQLRELVDIIKKVIKSLSRVFICIDALDKSTPQHRRELLQSLQEIVRVSKNTRIFITGRPHIEDEIVKAFSKVARIRLSPTQGDIKSYLEIMLSRDANPYAMDDKLRADIMRVIPEKTSEM